MSAKNDNAQVEKDYKKAARAMANTILKQPKGCYLLPEIYGPNRQVFREELVNILQWESGRNLETVMAVEMALAGDFSKIPQRLTCRLYGKLYFDKPIRERLPEKYLLRFSKIYQRLMTTLTTTVTERDTQVNETEFVTDSKQGQQAGGSLGGAAGVASGKISYTYDTSISNAVRERRRTENVVERQSQEARIPAQDAETVNTLNDLINELASVPLGLYFNHWENSGKLFETVIEREDWLKKWYAKFKAGWIMSLIDLLLIIPRLLIKTMYNIGQMIAKYFPDMIGRSVGKKHVRTLFIIHGFDISNSQAELVSAQLADLVSNQNAVFVIFTS
jgi:hypothetical protein